MNIVLLLNNDIASNLALNLLMPKLSAHQVSVFLSSKVGGKSTQPRALQELAKFEQKTIYQCCFLLTLHDVRNEAKKLQHTP